MKIRVSIGIAAHNEEQGITQVIGDLLHQDQSAWMLENIHIYCDGCSDTTADKARSVKNSKIVVHDDGLRKGKTLRWNQFFHEKTKADILCMLDADIIMSNKDIITQLIEPFVDQRVAVVGGNSRPVSGGTFFENAVMSTFKVFDQSRALYKGGHNIFAATGSIMAIRSSYAQKLSLPKIINEDAYVYLSCIRDGYLFRYANNAVINYYLPTNLTDYLRQVFRSESRAVAIELRPYFGQLVDEELNRDVLSYTLSVFKVFLSQPVEVLYISFINLLCLPLFSLISSRYKLEWFTAKSTHNRRTQSA